MYHCSQLDQNHVSVNVQQEEKQRERERERERWGKNTNKENSVIDRILLQQM
jgi:hypothetical protein